MGKRYTDTAAGSCPLETVCRFGSEHPLQCYLPHIVNKAVRGGIKHGRKVPEVVSANTNVSHQSPGSTLNTLIIFLSESIHGN